MCILGKQTTLISYLPTTPTTCAFSTRLPKLSYTFMFICFVLWPTKINQGHVCDHEAACWSLVAQQRTEN